MIAKKRILLIVTLFTLCLLIGCSTSEEEQLPIGSWQDHLYTNDLYMNDAMGIQFQLPNSWRAFTNHDLQYYQRFLERGFLSSPRINPELLSINGDFVNEMVAMNLSTQFGTMQITGSYQAMIGGSVQIISGRLSQNARFRTPLDTFEMMFQRVPPAARRYTAIDLLEIIEDDLRSAGITNVHIYTTPTRIGRYDFYLMQTAIDNITHMPFTRRIYLNLDEGHIRMIIATGITTRCVDFVMSYFSESGAFVSELTGRFERTNEILDPQELIGEWLWDEDECFFHTFNPDFTGTHTFCNGHVQPFDWTIIDGALFFSFESTANTTYIQIWQTSLVDDVLRITSFFAPDRDKFTYTRIESDD